MREDVPCYVGSTILWAGSPDELKDKRRKLSSMGVSSLCSLTAVSGCLATPYPLYSAGPTTLRLWDQRNLCPFQFFCSGVFITVTNISLIQCFTSIIYRQRIIITLANMYYLCVKCWPQGLNAGAFLIHATIRHGGTFSIPFKTQKLSTSSMVTDSKTRMNFSLNSQLQADYSNWLQETDCKN